VEEVLLAMVTKSMDIHVLPKLANATIVSIFHLIYGCIEDALTCLFWLSIIS
jgi:hypothetical protein